jgi:hypothetical protein
MATSVSALKAEITRLNERVLNYQGAATREADYTGRTGRISGSDSRYTLRVWFNRVSGQTFATLTHHHPGQRDSIIADGWVDAMARDYRSDNNEGAAILALLTAAQTAAYRAMRDECAI